MKKQLTRGFAAILAFCLIAALNPSLPLEASSETGEAWDAVEMFSADTPEPEPWGYYASLDGGETFSLMSVYAEEEWGNYWYSAEKEIGLGTNHDAEGYLEANVADANSAVAALGFTRLYFWQFTSVPRNITLPGQEEVWTMDRSLFSQIHMQKHLYPNSRQWQSESMPRLEAIIKKYEGILALIT